MNKEKMYEIFIVLGCISLTMSITLILYINFFTIPVLEKQLQETEYEIACNNFLMECYSGTLVFDEAHAGYTESPTYYASYEMCRILHLDNFLVLRYFGEQHDDLKEMLDGADFLYMPLTQSFDISERESESIEDFIENGGLLVVSLDPLVPHNNFLLGYGIDFKNFILASDTYFSEKKYEGCKMYIFEVKNITEELYKYNIESIAVNCAVPLKLSSDWNFLAYTDNIVFVDENLNCCKDEEEKRDIYPIVAKRCVGNGEILVLADSTILENMMINEADNKKLIDIFERPSKQNIPEVNVNVENMHSLEIEDILKLKVTVENKALKTLSNMKIGLVILNKEYLKPINLSDFKKLPMEEKYDFLVYEKLIEELQPGKKEEYVLKFKIIKSDLINYGLKKNITIKVIAGWRSGYNEDEDIAKISSKINTYHICILIILAMITIVLSLFRLRHSKND